MQTFVVVVVTLAMIAFGALLIHLLNLQHSGRIAAFHYGRSGMPIPGPDPLAPRKAHGRAGASGTARRRASREDGPSRPN
ncbi:hypothetical protein [Streptomyces sp. NBC_01092]|uniref:hypothetical protein n=1 Tax=Streptomyces sp. NBC_01092 TaxID=2903748 RepID=UPI00386B961A|nr:hypothetical protein OG254_35980 [Streptomyces sp. NBC_01092]